MKDTLLHFIFSSSFNWIPFAFFIAVVVGVIYLYLNARVSIERRRVLFVRLIFATIGFRIVFAILKTGLQYYAWASDGLTKLLLPPTQSITVFLHYVWTHFWINTLISLAVGLFMFGLLRALQKKNARFFAEGEIELGTLLALVVGWPHFVVFFPLVFIFVVLIGIVRTVFFKESLTTLGLPFIIAAIVALFFAMPVLSFLRLSAWII